MHKNQHLGPRLQERIRAAFDEGRHTPSNRAAVMRGAPPSEFVYTRVAWAFNAVHGALRPGPGVLRLFGFLRSLCIGLKISLADLTGAQRAGRSQVLRDVDQNVGGLLVGVDPSVTATVLP